MSDHPPERPNVWAGDVVRFVAPLGNLRRATWSIYAGVFGAMVGSALIMRFVPGGDRLAIIIVVATLWLAVLFVNDLIGTANRWLARRQLRRRACETLGDLAAICWLRSLVGPRSKARFDAAEWIRRTGPDGPRVVCREFSLAAVPPDPNATEEEAILPWLEESRTRRAKLWAGVAVWGSLSAWFGYRAILDPTVLNSALAGWACFMVIFVLRQLGVIGRALAPMSISPEGLRVRHRSGAMLFTRADSVLMIEPLGTSSHARLQWVRTDGKAAEIEVSIEPQAKMLPMVLARWSWRGRRGGVPGGVRLRELEPVPSEDVTTSSDR